MLYYPAKLRRFLLSRADKVAGPDVAGAMTSA
jgi:hypothetical protein